MTMSTCVDQRRAGLAAAGGDLEDVLGQAALAQALGHQQRGQRRDLGRLEDTALPAASAGMQSPKEFVSG